MTTFIRSCSRAVNTLLLSLLAAVASAQQEGLDLCPKPEQLGGALGVAGSSFPPEIVGLIADKVGLSLTDFRLVPTPGLGENAYAQYCAVLKWNAIFYDPAFIKSTPGASDSVWLAHFIFAHEVGHHIKNHFTTKRSEPRFDREAEADEWAGWVMYRIGAPIDKILAAIDKLNPSEAATVHYNGRCRRRMLVLRGYNRGARSEGKPTYDECLDCFAVSARGLVVKRSLQAGTRLDTEMLQSCGNQTSESDLPLNFQDHVAGGCLIGRLDRGTLLKWEHFGLCEAAK